MARFSRPTLKELKKTWMANLDNQCLFISAEKKTNIDELRKTMYEEVKKNSYHSVSLQ